MLWENELYLWKIRLIINIYEKEKWDFYSEIISY